MLINSFNQRKWFVQMKSHCIAKCLANHTIPGSFLALQGARPAQDSVPSVLRSRTLAVSNLGIVIPKQHFYIKREHTERSIFRAKYQVHTGKCAQSMELLLSRNHNIFIFLFF